MKQFGLLLSKWQNFFKKSRSTINEYIKNIYEEKELEEIVTMKKFGISDFSTKPTFSQSIDAAAKALKIKV
ncbi:hypothetical protein [Sulfurimonas sp. RIFOXYB12_FULL_35_9]|jgi:hypothetical protein|uniref:hypothetical protein n=1 Tax=Sulfurimonas sp. RIFOXYB12_FULL_35_9 TaxID=1802256 RepID=UPI0008D598E2|nr:hypothetical protein [Sulfurimonas sp. RIFOXYB12_FULL_35_9]OHE06100.1 MAG: hypothetical protein A2345_06105 [Sulfurimonas sp. RIFOXYB12_FULL_35_9]